MTTNSLARLETTEETSEAWHDTQATHDAPWLLYTQLQRWGLLAVLFLVSASNYLDRHIIAVLLEPIKHEFQVSDTLLGVLSGVSFTIFNALFAMPIARWADRGNRRTIITLGLAIWSVMTMLCGMAQTFWHLALARVGVGAGEAGAVPPAQSLIVDCFPPERRAMALAILNAAAVAGSLLAFTLGGFVAATYGWRTAFVVAGAPGLVLALIARLGLVEPRLKLGFRRQGANVESTRDSLRTLLSKRSYRYALIGFALSFVISYGPFVFIPSFLIRVLHVSIIEVSVTYGMVIAAASLVGTLCGGWLGDRLGRRDKRWLAWLAAVASICAGPIYIAALSTDRFAVFMALIFVANAMITASASIFAAFHAVCGSRRRATAIALLLLSATLIGGGLGPLLTGALSDALTAIYGPEGLRYSLMAMMTLMIASGVFYYLFGRAMPEDIEE